MTDRLVIVVPNPGSTSLKGREVTIYRSGGRITDYKEETVPTVNNIPPDGYADGVRDFLKGRHPNVVGFKAVHAGPDFMGCYELDGRVMAAMERFTPLAPLHNPVFLTAIKAAKEAAGEKPFYAANFETFYARDMPAVARQTCLPKELAGKHGIRRYGFHGNSHYYAFHRTARLLGQEPEDTDVITVHAGGSTSVARNRCGRVLETSMGISPEDTDIPMAARTGVDYMAMGYLMAAENLSRQDAFDVLMRRSGLVGISGNPGASDLRTLYAAIDAGSEDARLALDTFAYRIAREIGAQAMTSDFPDAITFTGGMAASDRFVRDVCGYMGTMGLYLTAGDGPMAREGIIRDGTHNDIETHLCRVETDEELVVAQACANLMVNGKQHMDGLFLK